jgi:hypothetical protein
VAMVDQQLFFHRLAVRCSALSRLTLARRRVLLRPSIVSLYSTCLCPIIIRVYAVLHALCESCLLACFDSCTYVSADRSCTR